MSWPISVYVVEDHPITLSGIVQLLRVKKEFVVAGQASSYAEAVKGMLKSRPDVGIVDISLLDLSGIDLIKSLRKRLPGTRFVVLSVHDEELYADRALRAGAHGYVMKDASPKVLLRALRRVMTGRYAVSDAVSHRLIERAAGGKAPDSDLDKLSDRELEIFNLLGAGQKAVEISRHLCVSSKTIETHKIRMKKKLGFSSTTDLVRYAISRSRD